MQPFARFNRGPSDGCPFRLATEADLTETERSAAGGRFGASFFGRLGLGFAFRGAFFGRSFTTAAIAHAATIVAARVTAMAAMATMAAVATTSTVAAMATMAAVARAAAAAIVAAAVASTATMAMSGRSLLFTTQEGDADHGEENRQAESKSTIHREVPPTKRYG